MESFFQPNLPAGNLDARQRIFRGEVFLQPGGPAALSLVGKAVSLLETKLGMQDIRRAHLRWSGEELFGKIGALRRVLYLEPEFHRAVRDIAAECGFDPARVAFDPVRLRVVLPGGHRNPLAAPVYYPHRDTWYAHPQALVVWWIPLHDLGPEQTFDFYPDFFARAVTNDSEIFDYREWIKDGPELKIGWQKRDSGTSAGYPKALEGPLPERAETFSCRTGDNLIFAGAHYHKTRPHDEETIRYSIDFRVVDLEDIAAGRGAPNADNRSRGDTVADYVHPAA